MSIDQAAARARARKTKRFLAACGLAGCLGGVAASSALAEWVAAPAASISPATGDTTGRVRVQSLSQVGTRPIWVPSAARKAPTTNPFLANGTLARPASSGNRPGVARVADGPRAASAGTVRKVGHLQATPACGSPDSGAVTTATDEFPAPPPGRASRDGRLPPAAPFGSANPFNTADVPRPAKGGTIPADATPVTAKPQAIPAKRVSQTNAGEKPVPVRRFLIEGKRPRKAAPGEVTNDDMIVNSALVPKRSEWRAETVPAGAEPERIDYPITPRRPFSAPSWQTASEAKPAATANLPVTITPYRTVETEPVSAASVSLTPAEVEKVETAAAPAAAPAASDNPFAAPEAATALEAAAAPDPAGTATEKPIETATEEPVLASVAPAIPPGPALPALSVPGPALPSPAAEPASAGPALAAAAAAPQAAPTRLETFGGAAVATPVDLAVAEQALKKARKPQGLLSTPLAVGLALAVVAIGAVMIRRRFT